ncbi:MAG: Fic family protein [Candidatus Methanoplasma sp.]|nr:Fic family protein [Candidatus Methanoplasma sp.]
MNNTVTNTVTIQGTPGSPPTSTQQHRDILLKYGFDVCRNVIHDPRFDSINEISSLVSEISLLIDQISDEDVPPIDLKLRRANTIRSIQSSLAIEGNTLSLEKVTDIVEGKRVLGNPREIQEVKGALKAYDNMDSYDPYSIKDLLAAHKEMMYLLVDEEGKFRKCGVGVFKGNVPVHIAPEHKEVPTLMNELIEWVRTTDYHPLIKSCIFHYRFEYIHPFVDGNGRMGRFWQSLILSKWKHVFAYLPVETWVKKEQQNYYSALQNSSPDNVTPFVVFMLRMIRNSVREFVEQNHSLTAESLSKKEKEIFGIISDNPKNTAGEIAELVGLSERMVRSYISALVRKEYIRRVGSDKAGQWEILRK